MKIAVIPDIHAKPNQDFSYLRCIGNLMAKKQPDMIISLGDFADMPSLSSYDIGKKAFEGRKYVDDIDAAKLAMNTLLKPIRDKQKSLREAHRPRWKPKLLMVAGNHDYARFTRAVDTDRKLEGLINVADLKYKEVGWDVIPFLEVLEVNGVLFSHYFCSGIMGRPITSADNLLKKNFQSSIAGHLQGRDVAYSTKPNGANITAIISGSCSPYDEEYLNWQTNNHWRGLWMLHNVDNGSFEEQAISLDYICKKYKTV